MTCHNERLKTGGLALDQLDVANVRRDAETWEKVVRKLRVGAMPPRGARRPDSDRVQRRLSRWLEGRLDAARHARNPGRPALHRLNRAEYANAIRDLLGLDVDVAVAPAARRFGVRIRQRGGRAGQLAGAAAGVPRRGARRSARCAVGDPRIGVGSDTYSVRQDLSQDVASRRPAARHVRRPARHAYVPARRRVRLPGPALSHEPERDARPRRIRIEVELTLDGERDPARRRFGGDDGSDRAADRIRPTRRTRSKRSGCACACSSRPGQRDVAAAFLDETPPLFETTRLQPFLRDFANPFAAEGAPHVQSISIQGPFNAKAAAAAAQPARVRLQAGPNASRRDCRARGGSCRRSRAGLPPAVRTPSRRADDVLRAGASARRAFQAGVRVRAAAHPREPVVRLPAGARAGGDRGRARRIASPTRAGVAALVLPLEQHPRRRAAATSRASGQLEQPDGAARSRCARMLADPRSIGARRATSPGSGCTCATSAASCPNSGAVPGLRRQPAAGVPARDGAVLRQRRARGPQRARL